MINKAIKIALAGNPNSGKTTLFNEITGTRQHVGNWPGVTVEKKEGKAKFNDDELIVTDLPGIYSLSPYSMEEVIARNYIINEQPDIIVNIVDASNIERNLYLSLQLMELGKPVIIALNMMDLAEKRGVKIECNKLSKVLGVPVIPIVANKGKNIEDVLKTAVNMSKGRINYKPNNVLYTSDIEEQITDTMKLIKGIPEAKKYDLRWLALKILEQDKEIIDTLNDDAIVSMLDVVDDDVLAIDDFEDFESRVADIRYDYISNIVSDSVDKKNIVTLTASDKADKILTNRWLGLPIFAVLMYAVYWFTFNIGNIFLDKIDVFFGETLSGWVTSGLESAGASEWLTSLVVDGVIGGVGGVLTFVPNIAFLFFAIAILEGSGYMARVAFIMDRAMRKIGLNGKAFIPMLMGFGCTVPAIMGTRTLENEKDRLLAILISPFMSCGARLPVYVLLAGAFFAGNEANVIVSLYALGILIAIIVGFIFNKTLFKGEGAPFVMELPPYRIPTVKGVLIHTWERVKAYLTKAGTVIFAASVVLWFILGYNFSGPAEIADSIGAGIGKFIAPIFAPLGFGNWQAALSLLSGLLAKEVVVSNMAIIYGLGEQAAEQAAVFGNAMSGTFNQLTAYAFMVFVLLYTPCVAVIGVIKRETNSWKWTLFSVGYQLVVAWGVALLVYQIGRLFI